jgi:hypothetical protein
MTRPNQWAAGVPAFYRACLLAGALLLSGCGSNQEGSVVLKQPLDMKTIGAPPKRNVSAPGAPQKNNAATKKMVITG